MNYASNTSFSGEDLSPLMDSSSSEAVYAFFVPGALPVRSHGRFQNSRLCHVCTAEGKSLLILVVKMESENEREREREREIYIT